MIKRSIAFVFFVSMAQMVIGTDLFLFLMMSRCNSLICFFVISFYAAVSFCLADVLAFPSAIRRKMPAIEMKSPSPKSKRRFLTVVLSPLLLSWMFLLYIACFTFTSDNTLLANLSLFARLNIIVFANLAAIVYGGFAALCKLEQIGNLLYSPKDDD